METGAPDESLPALDAAAEVEALLRRVAANGLDLDRRAHWTLLEGSPLSIVITRPDGSIAYSNPSAHRMLGVSRETYDGSNIIDFYRDPAERDRVYETVRRDGRLLNYELELLRGDGTPVWALISRVDLTGSSSSYHRYELIDQFIHRFGEWWLLGTRNTAQWGWDMWDTINSYVAAGTDGGLIGFVLFVAILFVGFRGLGKSRKEFASEPEHARRLWALGTMLFAHAVAFFGIGYFDQSSYLWYAELAMIAVAVSLRSPAAEKNALWESALLPPLEEKPAAAAEPVLVP